MISWQELVLRLLLATVFGGLVGWQRERRERPAGFRTHVLVCLGAALMMTISIYPFLGKPYADPSRIAAAVVVGMGFLGAGAIIRQGSIVVGLTTAASLWTVSGVGLAVGSGFYLAGAVGTFFILAVLIVFRGFEKRFIVREEHKSLSVVVKDIPGQLGKVDSLLGQMGVATHSVELNREVEGKVVLRLSLDIPQSISVENVFRRVSELESVMDLKWED